MAAPYPFALLLLFILSSCKNDHKSLFQRNAKLDTVLKNSYWDSIANSVPKKLYPIWGYRFSIEGDFDGDGRKEILSEQFFSKRDGRETNKFYRDLSYDHLIYITDQKQPYSFITCSNPLVDTLKITEQSQLLGLSFLKNEGDLNGDGTDEISYVINWADFSNMNTCYVMTYKQKHWQELTFFSIRDFQIPDLPGTTTTYGYFGTMEKTSSSTDDKEQKSLKEFPGFIKKLSSRKAQIRYINQYADEDTIIVNLKHPVTIK